MGFRRFRKGLLKKFLEHVANVGILEVREVPHEQRVNILNAGMQYPTRTVGPTQYGLLGSPYCVVVPLLSGIDKTRAASDASFLATGVIGALTGISVGRNDNKDNNGSHHLRDHLGASTSGNTRIVPSSTW